VRTARRIAAEGKLGMFVEGRFRVTDILGEGGMGVVFKAMDTDSGREVALKVLHPTAFSPSNVRRFRREGRAAYALRHPNICEVFGHGTLADGSPYIVMELLSGETLRKRLHSVGPLALGDAVAITLQLLDALSVAHARGVLHRDVKPSNIFLTTPRGQAPVIKLIDFGLAKLLPNWVQLPTQSEDATAITSTGVIAGTPHYLAPEQLDGSKNLDERADVWATGLVSYEMLAGIRAFDGENYTELTAAIALREPDSIRVFRSDDVPIELERVLARALAKDRQQRYANALAFRQALLDCWAKIRAEGIARGLRLLEGKVEPRRPTDTEVDVQIPIFIDSAVSLPTLRRPRKPRH
jgi:serine/threonine-protein kinase